MVLFALSCVGLLLFLWLSFGGKVPFNPQGYEVRISFTNAGELATQADVRIAGVSVGKVIQKSLDPQGNRTIATIQLDNQYAPLHRDARAILRTKTIIGETYVEITPGSPHAPAIPDGGVLSRTNVQNAVQLSDIYDAFDAPTRKAFQQWQQQFAVAVKGNDQNLNDTLGNLPTFAADATDILRVLDIEHNSVQNLVRNGSTVFAALSKDQSALRGLITSAHTTFTTTAQNNNFIAQTFHVFPTFLDETKLTMARLQSLRHGHRPADQGAVAGRPRPWSDAALGQGAVARPRALLRQPRAADHRRQDGPARVSRRHPRRDAAAGVARPVPRAAQPDPDLAVGAPAADLGLHLQRSGRNRRDDEVVRRRRYRSLPAPVLAGRARDAVVRARRATPTTAATPTRGRCGWQTPRT